MTAKLNPSQYSLFEEEPAPVSVPDLATFDHIVISSSGGKDSQAMLDYVCALADAAGVLDRVTVVHADLGRVEWQGTAELAQAQAERYGVPFYKVWRKQGDLLQQVESRGKFPGPDTRFCTAHHKQNQIARVLTQLTDETRAEGMPEAREGDLLSHIEERGKFPDAMRRFCTSDHKRSQIHRVYTHLTTGTKKQAKEPVRILSCMGMRGEESPARAKKKPLSINPMASNGKREVTDWLPLHQWKESEVWERIRASRTADLIHPCYALGMPRCSCCFCLAPWTEVVTRDGIKPIVELSGKTTPILIPKKNNLGLSGEGYFVPVEVRYFGIQPILRIVMHRGRQTKTVFATPEHRWILSTRTERPRRSGDGRRNGWEDKTTEATTAELQPGDRLRTVRAHSPMKCEEVPFAVAQGFVYGDGTKGHGERPATLTIYNDAKDSAILKYFAAHKIRNITGNDKPALLIYGLPRQWKEKPDYRESRSFLLSWLAGYFAADGTVSEQGQAKLYSASKESLQIARDIMAICGISYGPIHQTERIGTGTNPTTLYTINIPIENTPDWFFIIESHRERIAERRKRTASDAEKAGSHWTVDSVTETGETEEVYCAIVPDVHAFGLSDELMTGNCIFAPKDALIIAGHHNPELLAEYVRVEAKIGHRFRLNLSMAEVAEAVASGEKPATVSDWKM